MALLTCTDLTVGYGSDAVASNINMTVEPGDLLCVIGENGAGKSTLVKTVLGLIQPLGGTLEFAENLAPDSVGYLPQQGETQRDFPASVTEIVLSGCLRHLGRRLFYGPRERATANAAIERVGVADLAKRSFSTLSGGQRQRVLIARALCAATDLLVLDEPTTGLDPNAANELYDTIARLRAEGMGVISVSHDLEAALGHASNVLVVGKHPFFGTVEEYAALRADREV